jgi:hypothetical protein
MQVQPFRRALIVIAWIVSLVVVSAVASAHAQRSGEPKMVSGDDLAFVIKRVAPDGARVGTLLVRVNGRWTEAQFESRARLAK